MSAQPLVGPAFSGPPTSTHRTAADLLGPGSAPVELDPEVLTALDHAFLVLRRVMAKPASATLPVPSLGRSVELTKVMACEAIAHAHPDRAALTVKDLAEELQLDHSTTSRLLGEAEAEGLITRGSDPADRRRTTVRLTDTGRAVAADGAYIRTWFMGHVLSDWDPADVHQLVALLTRATHSFAAKAPATRAEAEARLGIVLPMDC